MSNANFEISINTGYGNTVTIKAHRMGEKNIETFIIEREEVVRILQEALERGHHLSLAPMQKYQRITAKR